MLVDLLEMVMVCLAWTLVDQMGVMMVEMMVEM